MREPKSNWQLKRRVPRPSSFRPTWHRSKIATQSLPPAKNGLDAFDGLVNAAGITDRGTIETTTLELWDRMFAINARAPFLLMQNVIAIMRKKKIEGAIVNIITMSSHGGQPYLTAYCASKGALATLTKNVAHSVRGDRIRVNGINLGWADTPNEHKIQMTENAGEDWLSRAEAEQPFGPLNKGRRCRSYVSISAWSGVRIHDWSAGRLRPKCHGCL